MTRPAALNTSNVRGVGIIGAITIVSTTANRIRTRVGTKLPAISGITIKKAPIRMKGHT